MFVCLIAGAVCTSVIRLIALNHPPSLIPALLLPRLCVCSTEREISASQIHAAALSWLVHVKTAYGRRAPCRLTPPRLYGTLAHFASFSTAGSCLNSWHSKHQTYGHNIAASLLHRTEKTAPFYLFLRSRERKKSFLSFFGGKVLLRLVIRPQRT